MSEMPAFAPPLDSAMTDMQMPGAQEFHAPTAQSGNMTVQTFDSVISAQRVQVSRDLNRVLQKLKILCATQGHRYVYSWEVNDKQNNKKTRIEGPTIKLANDLAREYGNCVVDVRTFDSEDGQHWIIYAKFTDIETGFSMTRPFQQRKNQTAGSRMNADRQMDIAFQIGVSKAIRNVVTNALQTFVDFMIDESKRGMADWVHNNKDTVWAFLGDQMEKHSIDLKQVEATIGRRNKEWTIPDLTRVYMEFRGIAEGFVNAAEAYPSLEDADEVMARKQNGGDDKKTEAKKSDPKPDDKKEPKPKSKSKSKAKSSDETKTTEDSKKDDSETKPDPKANGDKKGENLFKE